MRTLGKTLLTATIVGALALTMFAAQTKAPTKSETTTPTANELTCKVMANLTKGSAKGPQWIQCTPEMLKTNRQCQIACGKY
jgi:hypothetical protein